MDVTDPTPDQITVYATRWCGDCMLAKHVLKQMDIPYRLVDIDETPGAAAEVERLNGGMKSVPTILLPGGEVLVEPNRRQLEVALAPYRNATPAA